MMRSRFDEQLAELNRDLIRMGALCEEVIALIAKAVTESDPALLARVNPLSGEIDRMERTVETLCLRLLLQQQPVARDLRQISAALKMITDMDRIGVQAADIAEIIGNLRGRVGTECEGIRTMAVEAIRMVTESVDAYVRRDVALAEETIARDDVVDSAFLSVRDSLISLIRSDPDDGAYALDLLMIAKYFERIGDHAVNVAGWVVFSVTGEHKGGESV